MAKKSKKVIGVIGLLLLFFVVAVVTYFALTFSKIFISGNGFANKNYTNSIPEEKLGSYNILLLGYGGAGHDGGTLSDTIIVANINAIDKKVNLISVPRDTWVSLPIRSDLRENYKINAAFAIGSDDNNYGMKEPQYQGENGGIEMAKYAVSEVVGMPIDYIVLVDFGGFKEAIDLLGGVNVEVPVTFDDYFYPIKGREDDSCGKSGAEIAELHTKYSDTELHHQFECRYEHIHFDKGVVLMDGETALKFVRSRASAQHGGDFARSQRQQALILGIKDKVLSITELNNTIPFINKFADVIRTDVDEGIIQSIIQTHGNPKEFTVKTINLTEENVFNASVSLNGQSILIPKAGEGVFSEIHQYVKDQIDNVSEETN